MKIIETCGHCQNYVPPIFNVRGDECLIEPECKVDGTIVTPDNPKCENFKLLTRLGQLIDSKKVTVNSSGVE